MGVLRLNSTGHSFEKKLIVGKIAEDIVEGFLKPTFDKIDNVTKVKSYQNDDIDFLGEKEGEKITIEVKGDGITETSRNFFYETISNIIVVEEGIHKIKMYKSHTYNTVIGIAEVEINVSNEKLLIQYSSPLLVSQPGNIVISNFTDYFQIENIINSKEKRLSNEIIEKEQQLKVVEETTKKNSFWIIFWIIVVPAIFWIIYEIMLWDTLYDLY